MIFIKNCVKDLPGENVTLVMTEENDNITLDLNIRGEETVNLVKSSVPGVTTSMRRSLEYIGDAVNYLDKTDGVTITNILDNKPTEVAFFVKGIKTVLTETDKFPNTISKYEEENDLPKKNHHPRDMIVLIVPNEIDGDEVNYTLVVDKRNLGANTNVVKREKYSLIMMYVKWPIWAKLKFPAYAYVRVDYKDDRESIPYAAFKLGSFDNKKIQKNQIIDVDGKEAKDFLEESFRILREKKEKNNDRSGGFKGNKKFTPRNNYNKDNRYSNNNRPAGNNKKYRNNKAYK